MERFHEPELSTRRRHLLDLERNRCHPQRRDLFWDAAAWRAALADVIAGERRRDALYEQQIAALPSGAASAQAQLQHLYETIEADMTWHTALLHALHTRRAQYAATGSLPAAILYEIQAHEGLLETWLYACDVRLQQVALEFLEGRRAQGQLSSGAWSRAWNGLHMALHTQAQHWQQTHGRPLPQTVQDGLLAWFEQLQATQQATAQTCRGARDFDWRGLRSDARLVQGAIAALQPRRRWLRTWAAMFMLMPLLLAVMLYNLG